MKNNIMKKSFGIGVIYTDDNYTNNLAGDNFTVEIDKQSISICMDLSKNLRVQNKSVNCYEDAVEFISNHNKLKSIQISEQAIINGLINVNNRVKDPDWSMQLRLNDENIYTYSITPIETNLSIFLEVK